MVVDHQALADSVDNFDLLSIEQKARARRTVAHFSADAAECAEFLAMLGIAPSQERDVCEDANQPKLPSGTHKLRNPKLRQRP